MNASNEDAVVFKNKFPKCRRVCIRTSWNKKLIKQICIQLQQKHQNRFISHSLIIVSNYLLAKGLHNVLSLQLSKDSEIKVMHKVFTNCLHQRTLSLKIYHPQRKTSFMTMIKLCQT